MWTSNDRLLLSIPSVIHRAYWIPLAILVLPLPACRITDHSEKGDPDEQVTTELINHPTSGYEEVDVDDLPMLRFDDPHFDMGKVVQGSTVEHRFAFKNTGGAALLISDVRASCGCTVSKEWPRHPVKPGEEASILVTFDSEGRVGRQDKTVTVVANTTPPSTVLTLSGEVIGPAPAEPVD